MNATTWHAEFKSRPGSDLMFGRPVSTQKETSETHEQYEERTWKEKINITSDGRPYLQAFALKNALESAGRWLSMKIPGEGKKTFTDRFRKGVLIAGPLILTGLKLTDVEPRRLFVPSDGKRGSSRRVWRVFPTVSDWTAKAEIVVVDSKIDEEVLLSHLECCGDFIGFGSMRVENGGNNGRFEVIGLHS